MAKKNDEFFKTYQGFIPRLVASYSRPRLLWGVRPWRMNTTTGSVSFIDSDPISVFEIDGEDDDAGTQLKNELPTLSP